MSRRIIYGSDSIEVQNDDMTLEEAQEWAAEVFPGVADAEGHEDDDGNYVFTKRAGRKG